MKRKDDSKKQQCFRSTRMYKEADAWFFKTREGEIVGPFRDELEASVQLEVYIRLADAGMLSMPDDAVASPMPARNAG